MKVTAEFEVNQELENMFLKRLEDVSAGMNRDDWGEVEKMINEVKSSPSDKWSCATQKELVTMLLIDAGFTYAEGYYARAYEAPREN
jgi:hypothetical protein